MLASETRKKWNSLIKNIEPSRFAAGIVGGIATAIGWYLILYCTREILLIFSYVIEGPLWMFSPEERKFYNFFFAVVSLIQGLSGCLLIWFDQPMPRKSISIRRRGSVVNDQRVLNWAFLYWFIQCGFLYLICFGWVFRNVMSWYPDLSFFFYLILVVLLLQPLTTLHRVYGKPRWNWMLPILVGIPLLSLGIAQLNVLPMSRIYENLLAKDILNQYRWNPPKAKHGERITKKSLCLDIHVVYKAGQDSTDEPTIIVDNVSDKVVYALEEIATRIELEKECMPAYQRNHMIIVLHADREVPDSWMKKLKKELAKYEPRHIAEEVLVHEWQDRRHTLYKRYVLPASHRPNFENQ